MNPIGVINKKNIKNITIGATIKPSNNPSLNQILFRGNKIFELVNPNSKKITERIKKIILILLSLSTRITETIKNTTEKVIPKFLLVGNLLTDIN